MNAPRKDRRIELRGVRVHNLRIDRLDLPLGRLIAVTGVSGAGKSSLAFDTLYAEGQRRYVESLSAAARRYVERLERPDADSIDHIPPAVAVRQRTAPASRRATVATATEIHDHLRLLFSRVGTIVCPRCGVNVERHTPAGVADIVGQWPPATRVLICFRPVSADAAADEISRGAALAELSRSGFTRVICRGRTCTWDEVLSALPSAEEALAMLVVVDRLTAGSAAGARITESIEQAFRHGQGECVVLEETDESSAAESKPKGLSTMPKRAASDTGKLPASASIDGKDWRGHSFHERFVCPVCHDEFPEPEPAMFNFNSPLGACPRCRGLGTISAAAKPIEPANRQRATARSPSADGAETVCPDCRGTRLAPGALVVRVGGHDIAETARLTAAEVLAALHPLPETLTAGAREIAAAIFPQVLRRLELLVELGLGHLTLERPMRTLSAGEAQRVRLTSVLGSRLVNVLYLFDEPTGGMHAGDVERLIAVLLRLRDAGNTVLVVEHNVDVIRRADHVIDLGPGSGSAGGRVVCEGPPDAIAACPDSVTGAWLNARPAASAAPAAGASPATEAVRREPASWLRLEGIRHHNLDGLAVDFPLGVLCVVSGVSGAGKSSLVEETLVPALQAEIARRTAEAAVRGEESSGKSEDRATKSRRDGERGSERGRRAGTANRILTPSQLLSVAPSPPAGATGRWERLIGAAQLDEVTLIDQSPLGRSPRSNPATFLGLLGEIRRLFAETAEARARHYGPARFSFNTAEGGRCAACEGVGTVAVDMQFLPDVVVACPECHGRRFRPEILEVRYRGLSIAEVLALPAREAFTFFRGRTRLQRRLKLLKDSGLDYLALGQPAHELSGGEAQRLKLAAALARPTRARTLFVLSEPTTGLHPSEVARLLESFQTLLAAGHSVIVIEHDPAVIAAADYVIDLGPGAGAQGGKLVAAGPPEEIVRAKESITGKYLSQFLGKRRRA